MLKIFKFICCFRERSEKIYPRIFWICTFLSGVFLFHEPVTTSSQSQIVIEQISRGGGSKSDSNSFITPICLSKRKNFDPAFHRRLEKHFPDWKGRMDYQKKQEKFYRSGLAGIAEAKRVRVKCKLTKQEQNTFDYFNGQNFYKYYQSLETPPNIFDTRSSFLLKVEKNKNMRENFLKSYNRRKSEN